MKNLLSLFVFVSLCNGLHAQTFGNSKIVLQGKVTELFLSDSTEKPLDRVSIQIWSNNKLVAETKSAHRGKYRMEAPFQENYEIKYVQDGFVSKTVALETKLIKREESAIRLLLTIDISMFKDLPVAKAKVLRRKDNISWDLDYNKTMQDRIRKEISKARVTKSVL